MGVEITAEQITALVQEVFAANKDDIVQARYQTNPGQLMSMLADHHNIICETLKSRAFS